MNDIVQSSGAALRVSPGSGVSIDPASGEVSLDLAALQEGVEFVLAEADAGGTQVAAHRVRVVGVELPLTRFDAAAALGEVRFLGSAAPSWTLGTASRGWCRRRRRARTATGRAPAATGSTAASSG